MHCLQELDKWCCEGWTKNGEYNFEPFYSSNTNPLILIALIKHEDGETKVAVVATKQCDYDDNNDHLLFFKSLCKCTFEQAYIHPSTCMVCKKRNKNKFHFSVPNKQALKVFNFRVIKTLHFSTTLLREYILKFCHKTLFNTGTYQLFLINNVGKCACLAVTVNGGNVPCVCVYIKWFSTFSKLLRKSWEILHLSAKTHTYTNMYKDK